MGKNKQPDPEPSKIIRTLGENLTIPVTEDEKKYRNKHGPDDVKTIRKEKLKCTVCAKSVADTVKKATAPYVHMVLGVLMCKDCASFYGDGYFSVDEDGDDKYCRWCGQGGTLYLCSTCSCAFCKKCIKQNLNRQDVKDLESDDWRCFICHPKPLFECRTICWALQEHAKAKEGKQDEEGDEEEESTSSSRPKRDKSKKESKKEVTPASSKKRKASEMEEEPEPETPERQSKRRRSSDSGRDSKQQKHLEQESRPKRSRGSQPEEKQPTTPSSTSKMSRSSKKTEEKAKNKWDEEIVISDDEDKNKSEEKEEEENVKKSSSNKKNSSKSSKSSKKDSSPTKKSRKSITETPTKEKEEEKINRPKRSTAGKSSRTEDFKVETPKTASRSVDKKPLDSSGKKKQPNRRESDNKDKRQNEEENTDLEQNQTPLKRSRRSTKGKKDPYKDESDDVSSKKSDSDDTRLISLDDNSSSETENKSIRRTISCKSGGKPKISLGKNADSKVVQASGYINSAVKDVLELSVLISSRCEKLCSKSVQSSEDVLNAFSKLKKLMGGVHTNLELIGKGLDTKISLWKGEKVDENSTEKDEVSNNKLIEGEGQLKDITSKSQEQNKNTGENIPQEEEVVKEQQRTEEKMEVEDTIDQTEEKMETDNDVINQNIPSNSSSDQIEENFNSEAQILNSDNIDVSVNDENIKTSPEKCSKMLEKTDNEYNESDIIEETKADQEKEEKENDKEKEAENDEVVDTTQGNYIPATQLSENNEDTHKESIEDIKDNADLNEKTNKCEEDQINNSGKEIEGTEDGDFEEVKHLESNETEDNKPNDSEKLNEEGSIDNKVCENSAVLNEDRVKENTGEEESEGINYELAQCKTDSTEINKNDSIDSVSRQASAIKVCDSQNNGITEINLISLDKEDVLDNVFREEQTEEKKEEENPLTENQEKTGELRTSEITVTKEEEKTGTPVKDTNCTTSTTSETNETEELKNGSTDDEKCHPEKEDKNKEKDDVETKITERKEDIKVVKISTDDQKISPKPHQPHSSDANRRPSSDRGHHPHERWSGDRGRDWNRDRYHGDRWSGGRGGSWNRYDDRRPNRGGWGWNR